MNHKKVIAKVLNYNKNYKINKPVEELVENLHKY